MFDLVIPHGRLPPGSPRPLGTVILAEDDPDLRAGLAVLLRMSGRRVQEASDGAQLLQHVTAFLLHETPILQADAVITDVRMPGFNGLVMMEGLRAEGLLCPILVMSAFADDQLRARVLTLGRSAFLAKPFDPEELEAALSSLMER